MEQMGLLFIGSLAAGFLGALSGLGGGIIIVPLLVLGFGVDFHMAVGASLVAVIATSSVASATYVQKGFVNVRIAIFLATATVLGGVIGAYVSIFAPKGILMVLFGLLLLYSAIAPLLKRMPGEHIGRIDPLGEQLRLNGSYSLEGQQKAYQVHHVGATYLLMFTAGIFSGLLGIGSGAVKVLALDRMMQLPFRVSTTTSNTMIGITAVGGALLFWKRGLLDFQLISPIVMGISIGAFIGSWLFASIHIRALKTVFTLLILVVALEMVIEGIFGV